MTDIVYSQRLGTLSDTQFQAALDHFGLGRLIRAEPIPYGLFGQNVFLTSSAGDFILRGSPHFWWQFETEAFHAQFLHEQAHMPAPIPYRIDDSTDIFGWSYVIMPRMPGLQLADPQVRAAMSAEDSLSLAFTLGETLAALQMATYPHSGRYVAGSGKVEAFDLVTELAWPLPVSWFPQLTEMPPKIISFSERTKAVLRWHLEHGHAANSAGATEADLMWVEQYIADADAALDDSFEPCIVLQDYRREKTVATKKGERWQVTGIFDLMEAYFGDGEIDLSRQCAMYVDEEQEVLAEKFLQGYLSRKTPRSGFAQRFRVYMLLDRAQIWSYFQQHSPSWRETHPSFRAWAAYYLSLADTL
jgi:hygromycin-B 7''-O-kinase